MSKEVKFTALDPDNYTKYSCNICAAVIGGPNAQMTHKFSRLTTVVNY